MRKCKKRPETDRFWEKVDKSGECWEWTGAKDADGYGTFKSDGKSDRAHRVSWRLATGENPKGCMILHKCDNPSCVRPDHLYSGTHQQNEQDKSSRGRTRNRFTPERKQGLTAEKVVQIRIDPRSGYVLAKEYGVSPATIYHARTGHTWSNIPRDS